MGYAYLYGYEEKLIKTPGQTYGHDAYTLEGNVSQFLTIWKHKITKSNDILWNDRWEQKEAEDIAYKDDL